MLLLGGLPFLVVDAWMFRRMSPTLSDVGSGGVRRLAPYLVYVALFGALYISVCVTPFLRNGWVRWLLSISFALNGTAFAAYSIYTGLHRSVGEITWLKVDFSLLETVWDQRAMIPLVIRDYWLAALYGLTFAGVIATIFGMTPPARHALGKTWAVLALGSMVAALGIVVRTNGSTSDFPLPATFLSRAAIQIALDRAEPPADLSPPTLLRDTHRPLRAVILIMDESIASRQTTLGDPAATTTPKLAARAELANFGTATSAHNCSLQSRYIFRYGIRPGELPHSLTRGLAHPGPTLWQYAARAGYRTVFVNGFGGILPLQGGGVLREARDIAQIVTVAPKQHFQRDIDVADAILDQLRAPGPVFIYADKFGVHFPYELAYPPERRPFAVAGGGDPHAQRLAHYRNGLSWSVDAFFERLLAGIDLRDVLIVYTSDHGLNFQRANPFDTGQCSTGARVAVDEGLVPMAILTEHPQWRDDARAAAAANRNRTSHFQVFPTLLAAMGYDRSEVQRRHGPSLLEPAEGGRAFLVGSRTFLRWVSVD